MTRLIALAIVALAAPAAIPAPPTFERDVQPILTARCAKCHGAKVSRSGLDLSSAAAVKRGGDTGPAVVPGDPARSLLLEQITSGAMPPGKATKLTPAEVATVKAWIAAGAPGDAGA